LTKRESATQASRIQGDARELDEPTGSVDVVLLLGPLYHLTEAADRLGALGEAHRVLRSGGLLFSAGISRYAALLDLLVRLDRLHEPDVWVRVREAVATGVFRGHAEGLFTTAYFHLPEELEEELSSAGFSEIEVFNIEGPGFLVDNFADRWADPAKREAMLEAARLVEQAPSMMGASSHLLAVGRSRPQ
jgi:SAM-dependent methyltransferase